MSDTEYIYLYAVYIPVSMFCLVFICVVSFETDFGESSIKDRFVSTVHLDSEI